VRRLLIVIAVLYIVWRILGIVSRRLHGTEDARRRVGRRQRAGTGADSHGASERRLVACAHCGTLVPEDRAVRGPDGALYCERSCLEAGGTTGREVGDAKGKLPPSAPRA